MKEKNISPNTNNTSSGFHLERWHIVAWCMVLYDIIAVNASYALALFLRFDFRYSMIPDIYLKPFYQFAPFYTVFCIILFYFFHLYNSIWKYASYDELYRIIISSIVSTVFHVIGITCFLKRMPLSYYIMGAILQFIAIALIRFSYRLFVLLRNHTESNGSTNIMQNNVMLIGAGNAGQAILRDINRSKEVRDRVVCIIDDDPNKIGRYIDGIQVIGDSNHILHAVEEYKVDKIYLAIPSATATERRNILNICKETDCELKNLPGMYQFMTGEITASKMKKVSVEDLLGRDPVKADMTSVYQEIEGKIIMVTGGGGSIGSELCRQIAAHNPRQLIIFDIYENNAYDIQIELKNQYPDLNLVTLIGSVRDSRMIFKTFDTYRPEIVYHAAAHKHVPLMEDCPNEAIKNNAIGTYKTAFAALCHGCKRFVLISTDKAVNPTNIMGASKRLCEMICQAFDHKIKEGKADEIPQLFTHTKAVVTSPEIIQALKESKTEFVAVRFGNVLGSNGSVIPLFRKQIENGQDVTVTHPDIIRYFMTIPEAVGLVLAAGSMAKGGEIFVLDMGEPVKIDTLARNLIRLSGYKPDVDIKIVYTGLRPGEKLYEEKLMAEEGLKKTDNNLIFIGCPIPFDIETFLNQLNDLMEAAYKNQDNIRDMVKTLVSTYHPV